MPSGGQLLLLVVVVVAVAGIRYAVLLYRRASPRRPDLPLSGTNLTFGEWGDGQGITWSGTETTKVYHTVRRVARPKRADGAADEAPVTPGEVDFDHPLVKEMMGELQQSLRPLVVTTDPAEAERFNRVFSEAGISFSVEAEERDGAYEARLLVAEHDFARAKALVGPEPGQK